LTGQHKTKGTNYNIPIKNYKKEEVIFAVNAEIRKYTALQIIQNRR
jgi:hypothetical protein